MDLLENILDGPYWQALDDWWAIRFPSHWNLAGRSIRTFAARNKLFIISVEHADPDSNSSYHANIVPVEQYLRKLRIAPAVIAEKRI